MSASTISREKSRTRSSSRWRARSTSTAPGSAGVALRLPAGVLILFMLVPVVALLWTASRAPHLLQSLTQPSVGEAIRLTVFTTTVALLLITGFGTPLAFLLARQLLPANRLIQTIVDLPLVLPPMVAGVALLMAFGRQGLLGGGLNALGIDLSFSTAAVIMAQAFVAGPFFIRSARLGFLAVDRHVEEAGGIDGASFWQVMRYLTLPLASPGLRSGLVLSLGRALSEFGATLLFAGNFEGRTQTMSLLVMQAMQSDLTAALEVAALLVLLSISVLVFSQLISTEAEAA